MKHLYLSLLFACTLFSEIKAQVDVGDSLALVDLYNSTDGPNWTNHYNWLQGPVKSWYGVSLSNNRVYGLKLYKNNLTGTIPESFGNLSSLSYLYLFKNHIDSIKTGFGNLTALSNLILDNNRLSSLPEDIGNLSALSNLSLTNNRLSNLPESFSKLHSLSYLYLGINQLSSLPANFDNLSSLVSLYLDDNNFTTFPESLIALNSLSNLSISNNKISSLPENFGDFRVLSSLFLSNNQLSSLPESFGNLSLLSELFLPYNQIKILPENFGNLHSLEYLYLNNNQLNSLPQNFGNLILLGWLFLSNNQLSSLPDSFYNLSSLISLELGFNQFSIFPESISNLNKLSSLFLSHNQLKVLPESFSNLSSSLYYMDISYNQLNNLPENFGNLSTLVYLYLNNNQLGSLPESFGNLSSLAYLDLSYNKLQSIPESFGNLGWLGTLYMQNNQLSSLPKTTGNLGQLNFLFLDNNNFVDSIPSCVLQLNSNLWAFFSNNFLLFDIEPSVGKFQVLSYSPQANIQMHQEGNRLSVSAGGTLSNNTYEWYRDGQLVATNIGDSTYTITVDGAYNVNITNSICTQLTLYSDTINTGILPLTLLNFTASLQNKNALLNWSTGNEINTAYFNIQRSTDGIHFSNIGKLNAQGSSSTTMMYSFTDAGITALAADKIFYRLQVTDKNGSYQYSKIIALDIASVQNNFVVYPNPVKDVLHVQLNGTATLVFSNSEGKILFTKIFTGSGEINVAALPSGLYYLKNIETGEVKKVIVK